MRLAPLALIPHVYKIVGGTEKYLSLSLCHAKVFQVLVIIGVQAYMRYAFGVIIPCFIAEMVLTH
jgi:hypothetical protein